MDLSYNLFRLMAEKAVPSVSISHIQLSVHIPLQVLAFAFHVLSAR